MYITKDSLVTIHYTLKDESGKVLDSSEGQAPLEFIHGSGMIIKGLERELEGKQQGDSFTAKIAPEDAYGLRSDEHISTVPISQFDQTQNVKVGARFQVGGQGGTIAEVIAVDAEKVTVDTNHPLADQTLFFDVEVVSLKALSAEEVKNLSSHSESDCCAQGTCSN